MFLYLCAICLGSCKSAQVAPAFPVSREYGLQAYVTSKAKQPDATLPELTADLSVRSATSERITAVAPRPMAEPTAAWVTSAADTARKRAIIALDSALLLRPDPKTNTVNIIGGFTGAVGVGLMVASVVEDAPTYTISAAYKNLVMAEVGLLLLLAGGVLLLYQGENGRRRLRRNARRNARYSQKEASLEDLSEAKRQALKGLGMLLGGCALALLTFSSSLALIVGFPALIIALVGFITLIRSAL